MARGLPKSYIKKYGVSKKAWREYRKSKAGKKTRKTAKAKKSKKRSYTMAKKKKTRRSRKFTIPLAVVTPFVWKLKWPVLKAMAGDYDGAVGDLLWHFAAIDSSGNFNPEALKTWLPVIFGLGVHKFVGGAPLNLNRMLANANVPLIRI